MEAHEGERAVRGRLQGDRLSGLPRGSTLIPICAVAGPPNTFLGHCDNNGV